MTVNQLTNPADKITNPDLALPSDIRTYLSASEYNLLVNEINAFITAHNTLNTDYTTFKNSASSVITNLGGLDLNSVCKLNTYSGDLSLADIDSFKSSGIYIGEMDADEDLNGDLHAFVLVLSDNSSRAIQQQFSWSTATGKMTTYSRYLTNYEQSVWTSWASDKIYFEKTWSELNTLVSSGGLTPNATYYLYDFGQDEGLLLTAISTSLLDTQGSRLGLIPAHIVPGTYGTNVWGGVWTSTTTGITAGTYYVYCGRVWKSLTGVVGTADSWALDATNWQLMIPTENIGTFYVRRTFNIEYKLNATNTTLYPKGYIYKQWDNFGNEFGEVIEPSDGFIVDYNDWSLAIDGGVFRGNKLKRCYQNQNPTGQLEMSGNNGGGIIRNSYCEITSGYMIDNLVSNNGIIDNIKLSDGGRMYDNTIHGTVSNCSFVESFRYNTVLHGVTISNKSVIEDAGNIEYCSFGLTWTDTYSHQSTSAFTVNTIPGNKVMASAVISAGTATIPQITGNAFTSISATTTTLTVENSYGVTTNSSARTLTIKYPGLYRVFVTTSASVSNACTIETVVAINDGTYTSTIPQWYNKKNYSSNEAFQTTSIPAHPVYLDAGDVLSIKYRHTYAGALTLTVAQINISIEKVS